MKEQDLREKFKRFVNGYVGSLMLTNTEYPETIEANAEKCVQIAKDYAEQEVRNSKLPYQLFFGKVADILGKEKTSELLKESIEAFKNKENER